MAFPVIQNTASSSDSSDTMTHTVTLPSSITANNLLLVFFAMDGGEEVMIDTSYSGTNWSIYTRYISTYHTAGIIVKIAEGGGNDALQLTTDNAEAGSFIALQISGIITGIPISFSTPSYTTSSNMDPPSLTPGFGEQDYLWIVFGSLHNNICASGAPTNFGNLITSFCGGTGPGCSVASRSYRYGSHYDPGTFYSASGSWIAYTLTVNPIEAGGISIPMFAYYNF